MGNQYVPQEYPSKSQLRDLIEACLENQSQLNTKAYGTDWMAAALSGERDYPLAAGFEITEFGNSWNKWNWWSKGTLGEHEFLNMQVEVVDALHFILSDILCAFSMREVAVNCSAAVLDYVQQSTLTFASSEHETRYITSLIKSLLMYSGGVAGSRVHSITALENLYRLAMHGCGLGFKSLATMYQAKSILNQFRQDNGYKQKQYTKIWATAPRELEDNHVLMSWISGESPIPKRADILTFLQDEYAKVKARQAILNAPKTTA